jgi:hypothetical protein
MAFPMGRKGHSISEEKEYPFVGLPIELPLTALDNYRHVAA